MKKIIIYSLLAITALVGCRKSDNPKLPTFIRVPMPLFAIDETSDDIIVPSDPAGFSAKYSLDLFYPNDVHPKKMDIVVIKNGDHDNVKVLQADVTTFPIDFTLSGAQIVDFFGSLQGGDYFEVGADITTQDGVKYPAFPVDAVGYGVQPSNIPGANLVIRVDVFCEFIVDEFVGNGEFEVVSDEWADYKAGDDITLTKVDATHVSFKYKANAAQPIVVGVDLVTNQVSADKQPYGNYGGNYGTFSAQTDNDPKKDFVSPCAQTLSIKLHHTADGPDGGDFGTSTIVIQKK